MDADPTIGLTFSFSEYLTEDGAGSGRLLVSACDQPDARALVERNHVGNGSTPILRADAFAKAGFVRREPNACGDNSVFSNRRAHTVEDPAGFRKC